MQSLPCWDLFSACSCPTTLAGTQKLRYRKSVRKRKNFCRILSSYILGRIHANFIHLRRSSILSLASSVLYPALIKMLGVYHPLNSVLQAKPLTRLQNKSNRWVIYCKTPLWIFSRPCLGLWKVAVFFLWSAVSWMKDETYQHLNTNYFSNFAEGCEEFETTHTSILDCLKK